jgi:hypothetical protein
MICNALNNFVSTTYTYHAWNNMFGAMPEVSPP